MTTFHVVGIDSAELATTLERAVDHGGNPIEPFLDREGGWPLRCCLRDSRAGDRIAVIAWCPFPWEGAYAETGPIVVHSEGCPGPPSGDALPPELDARAMVLRPYGPDRRIAYHQVRHAIAGGSLTTILHQLLDETDVDFVHGRNVIGGCFSFQATRR